MIRHLSLLLALAGTLLPASALAQSEQAASVGEVAYSNYADDFDRLIRETRGLDPDVRAHTVLSQLQALFPEFYGAGRYREQSEDRDEVDKFLISRTRTAITRYETIVDAYRRKLDRFVNDLPGNIARFRARFADFHPPRNLVVLHSLGELDGGTRTLRGENFLIFGIDGMVEFHDFEDDTAFFQHELFHAYHADYFASCEALWCDVWQEGLAALASHRLVPHASEAELLLDWPSGTVAATRAKLRSSLVHLEANAESDERDVYAAFLQTSQDATGLPPRRGYYLGYLIAREAERHVPLEELARLQPDEARAVYEAALDTLIETADLPRFITMRGEWSSRAVRSEPASFLADHPHLAIPHRIVGTSLVGHAAIDFTVTQQTPDGRQTSLVSYVYDREAKRSFGVFANADGSTSRGEIEHRGDVDILIIRDAKGAVTWRETKTWISDDAFLSEGELLADGTLVRVWYRTSRVRPE